MYGYPSIEFRHKNAKTAMDSLDLKKNFQTDLFSLYPLYLETDEGSRRTTTALLGIFYEKHGSYKMGSHCGKYPYAADWGRYF